MTYSGNSAADKAQEDYEASIPPPTAVKAKKVSDFQRALHALSDDTIMAEAMAGEGLPTVSEVVAMAMEGKKTEELPISDAVFYSLVRVDMDAINKAETGNYSDLLKNWAYAELGRRFYKMLLDWGLENANAQL
jgi:hypothetical protein